MKGMSDEQWDSFCSSVNILLRAIGGPHSPAVTRPASVLNSIIKDKKNAKFPSRCVKAFRAILNSSSHILGRNYPAQPGVAEKMTKEIFDELKQTMRDSINDDVFENL